MPVSEAIEVGAQVLDATHFLDPHFRKDFKGGDALVLPTPGSPATTGEFGDYHWFHQMELEGGWAENYVANKERQKYACTEDPPPDNWSPFEMTAEGLKIHAEEIPAGAAHANWCTGKRYDENSRAQDLFESDYGGRGNIPGTEGVDWQVESDGRVLWLRYPLTWRAGILHTGNGRAGLGQGEFRIVGKMPVGATYTPGDDLRQQECAFGAFWLIQQFLLRRGRNFEPTGPNQTRLPWTGSHLLNEIDSIEHGGFDPYTAHYSRHMHYQAGLSLISDGIAEYLQGFDLTQEVFDLRTHITPERIGIGIGRLGDPVVYRRVLDTPEYWRKTIREYQLSGTNAVYSNGVPVELGEVMDGADPRVPEFMALMNIAISGSWLRDRMIWERQTILNRGYSYPGWAQTGDGRNRTECLIQEISFSNLVEAQWHRFDGSLWEPYKDARTAFDIVVASALYEGMPALRAYAKPKPGVSLAGRSVVWTADPPLVDFIPADSLSPVLMINGALASDEVPCELRCEIV